MEMVYQKDLSQCGMGNADCGIGRRDGRRIPDPSSRIPNDPIPVLLSCLIVRGSVKKEFTKECQFP
jgi:hypothetical protein